MTEWSVEEDLLYSTVHVYSEASPTEFNGADFQECSCRIAALQLNLVQALHPSFFFLYSFLYLAGRE